MAAKRRANGQGSVYQMKSGRWRVRFRLPPDENGKRGSDYSDEDYATKAEAEVARKFMVTEREAAETAAAADPVDTEPLVGEVLEPESGSDWEFVGAANVDGRVVKAVDGTVEVFTDLDIDVRWVEWPLDSTQDAVVAADWCRVLGIKNVSDAVSRVPEGHKVLTAIGSPIAGGQRRDMLVVTRTGTDYLTMQSNKPKAREFQARVFEKVDNIRRHGMAVNVPGMGTAEESEFAKRLAASPVVALQGELIRVQMEQEQQAKEQERQAKEIAEIESREQERAAKDEWRDAALSALHGHVTEHMAPKVAVHEAFLHSDADYSLNDTARALFGIGRQRFVDWLREVRIFMSRVGGQGECRPYIRYEEKLGWFVTRMELTTNPYRPEMPVSRVTPKGLVKLYEYAREHGTVDREWNLPDTLDEVLERLGVILSEPQA